MTKWIKTEVRRLFADAIAPVVSDAGFRYKKGSQGFVRKIDGGRQELLLSLVDRNPLFEFSLTLCIRLEAVQEITNRFTGSLPEYHGISVTSITQLEHMGLRADRGVSVRYCVESEADLTAILPRILTVVRERVLPFFEEYRDLAAVNRGLNPKGTGKWWTRLLQFLMPAGRREFDATDLPYRAMKGVTVAHLARDPRLAALITAYRCQVSSMPESDRQKFENLVDYLSADCASA